jgi:hypothetical protein
VPSYTTRLALRYSIRFWLLNVAGPTPEDFAPAFPTCQNRQNDEPLLAHGNPAAHLFLQGKDGVGNSLIASSLAKYYKSHGVRAICIETDPVNQTFWQYAALGAQQLKLMDRNQLRRRQFSSLMESILGSDKSFIVDNGASTAYMPSGTMAESCEPRSIVVWTRDALGQARKTERRSVRWRLL